ncbi:MAG: HlyD family type I secretion periplasmic adaptor subunit [Pseudomonadota bacterium]
MKLLPKKGPKAEPVEMAPKTPSDLASGPELHRIFVYLALVIGLSFGGFVTWGFAARLDSAAYGVGSVAVESSRKTIQHLEGGIVQAILVREGQAVEAGQPLIVLDDTQAKASLGVVESQLYAFQARRARLLAELEGLDAIEFPPSLLLARDDPDVEEVLINQSDLFTARREAHANQVFLLQNRVAELDEQIAAYDAQASAASEQLGLIRQEIAAVEELLAKGLETKPRLLALQRASAELRGRRGELQALVAQSRQTIGTTELELADLENQRRTNIVDDLDEAQNRIADLTDRATAARDVLARSSVLAPEAGLIVDLQVSTTGGVVRPGEPLMDIVPLEDRLIIEAKIPPRSVNAVHPGLAAQVQLPSFSRRQVPMLAGEVLHVSADQLIDNAGNPYFAVDVALTDEALASLPDSVALVPGMPANVLIALGERQAIDYLLSPIMDAATFAMREQ